MTDPASLPGHLVPVLGRWRRAKSTAERVASGTDACHAITKYVALVRLAEWRELGDAVPPSEALSRRLARIFEAPSLFDWYRLVQVIEKEVPLWTPALVGWKGLGRTMRLAASMRLFRHARQESDASLQDEAELAEALDHLLEVARPLLDLPLLLPEPGSEAHDIRLTTPRGPLTLDPYLLVLGEGPEGVDTFTYDSYTGGVARYEFARVLREVPHLPEGLRRAILLVQAAERDRAAARTARFTGSSGEAALATALSERLSAAIRPSPGATQPVARVETQLLHEWQSGRPVEVAAMVAGSGQGKTFEALRWLAREREGGRVPLLLRAATWSAGTLVDAFGTAAAEDEPTAIPSATLVGLCSTGGVSLVLDGVNEAADPDEVLARLIEGARGLRLEVPAGLRILLTFRPESRAIVDARLPPEWRASARSFSGGVLTLGPLSTAAARDLWAQATQRGWPSFESLPTASRRLVRVPVFTAFALSMEAGASSERRLDDLVGHYVIEQTTNRERALLRHLGLQLWDRRCEILDAAALDEDDVLAEAVAGSGPDAAAWAALRERGVVEQAGRSSTARVRFAVDRVAEHFLGHALADRHRGRGEPPGGWGVLSDQTSRQPILRASLALAAAVLDEDLPGLLVGLAGDPDPARRRAGRMGIVASSPRSSQRARDLLQAAWRAHPSTRVELLPVALEVGDIETVASAFRSRDLAVHARHALSREVAGDPDTVAEALLAVWSGVRRWPLLHLPTILHLGRALLQLRVAEGARALHHHHAVRLTAELASALVGGAGPVGRLRRRLVLWGLSWGVASYLTAIPTNWAPTQKELAWFLRQPVRERLRNRPLVDLFTGDATVDAVRPLALEVARRSEYVPTFILERALIAATLRPADRDAAFELVRAVGEAGRCQRPVTMAAQGVLYVYSTWLECSGRDTPGWARRAAEFREELDAWLAAATDPPRQWTSSAGYRVKALFVAAELGIRDLEGAPSPGPLVERLWRQALDGDTNLAIDLLDDLAIVGTTSGQPSRALAAMGPLLDATRVDDGVIDHAVGILSALRGRDPEAVDDALAGEAGQRPLLREGVARSGADVSPEQALSLNFDAFVILPEAHRPAVAALFQALLEASSLGGFLATALSAAGEQLVRPLDEEDAEGGAG